MLCTSMVSGVSAAWEGAGQDEVWWTVFSG